jgi:hypothetical protein
MFILKDAFFILNYQIYHFKWLVYITKFWLRKKCWWNYETSNGIVNDAHGIFEDFIETISKSFVWIHFHNL